MGADGRSRAVGWRLPGTVLVLAGAGLLIIVVTGRLNDWIGRLAAVLLLAGLVSTGAGMIVEAVRVRRQRQ